MSKVLVAVSLFLLIGLIFGQIGKAQGHNGTALRFISEFEGGRLYEANNSLPVLELEGNYREMGRQEGWLLKDQLTELYSEAIKNNSTKIAGLNNTTYQNLESETQYDFQMYPRRFQQILYGMSETSGLDRSELVLLNQMIRLGALELFAPPSIQPSEGNAGHCSAIAAWGNYTTDGRLIFGRNLDWRNCYKRYAKFVAVTVYNPNDGSLPTASVGYIGSLEILNGMNSQGLFIELNDGSISGGEVRIPYRRPWIDLTEFLFDSNMLEQLGDAINSTSTFWPAVVNVADENTSHSYEWATYAVKQRESDRDGLLVATNHFVNPKWGFAEVLGDPSQTVTRRNNLLNLGDRYKGHINVATMERILDTPYEKGGATRGSSFKMDEANATETATVIQIIAVPKDRTLWIQTPGFQNRTEVNLKRLFQTDSLNITNMEQTGEQKDAMQSLPR